ncbi:hypothetical protein HG535_0D02370 [Zygotorulaspora mrakii]|uniref:Nucleoporin Nup159/Nup146 N-terminal domain-containing protein n=1 Tax=Zygotorulaspora mrakii TaxID=42260 RepID=A0A7H9B3L5_ZYGMR|nr:uncharacterized protein HG535_0D02370 [Zygotorulaspora mrakii]QLG72529.1 hypothetical protein HG535_0D02370 [Zygotorulaspora mrakii]
MSTIGEEIGTITSENFGFKKLGQSTILPSYDEKVPFAALQNFDISNTNNRYVAASADKIVIGELQLLRDFIQNDSHDDASFLWESNLRDIILVKIFSNDTVIAILKNGTVYSVSLSRLGDLKEVHNFSHGIVQSFASKRQNRGFVLESNGTLHTYDPVSGETHNILDSVASFDVFDNVIYTFGKDYTIRAHSLEFNDGKVELKYEVNTPTEMVEEFHDQYFPLSINVLDTNHFLLVYGLLNSESDDEVIYDHKMFIMNNSSTEPIFQESFDITPAFGSVLRYPAYYNLRLFDLVPESKITNIITSSCSSEVTIWDSKEVVQPSQDSERAVLPISKITDNDTNPVGIALDISTTGVIANPCPGVDVVEELPLIYILNNEGSVQIVGLYHSSAIKQGRFNINALREYTTEEEVEEERVTSNVSDMSVKKGDDEGHSDRDFSKLTLVSSVDVETGKSNPIQRSTPPKERQATDTEGPLLSSTASGKSFFDGDKTTCATTSIAGSPVNTKEQSDINKTFIDKQSENSGFGSTYGKPAFGKTEFGKAESGPTVGKLSFGKTALGATEASSPFGKPSFGKTEFGATEASSPFGKPSFGKTEFGATEASSPFGKPSFGKTEFGATEASSPFGKPSFGKTEFGATKASSPFGKPSFGKTEFGATEASSPFGKPSFGKTEFGAMKASSPFGKPSFGKTEFGATEASSPFGKPSFGKTEFGATKASSPFGNPSFGKTAFGTAEASPPFDKMQFGSQESGSAFGKPLFGKTGFGSTESSASFGSLAFGKTQIGGGGSGAAFDKPSFRSTEIVAEKTSSQDEKPSLGRTEFSSAKVSSPFGKAQPISANSGSTFMKAELDKMPSSSTDTSSSDNKDHAPVFGKPEFGKAQFSNAQFDKEFGKSGFRGNLPSSQSDSLKAGKQPFSGFASFNSQTGKLDNPFLSSSNSPSPFANLSDLSLKTSEKNLKTALNDKGEEEVDYSEVIPKDANAEGQTVPVQNKQASDEKSSPIAETADKNVITNEKKSIELRKMGTSIKKEEGNMSEQDQDLRVEGIEESQPEYESEFKGTETGSEMQSVISSNSLANDKAELQDSEKGESIQDSVVNRDLSDNSSSTNEELTNLSDSTIEDTASLTKLSNNDLTKENSISSIAARLKDSANILETGSTIRQSKVKSDVDKSLSPSSSFNNDMKTSSNLGFTFKNMGSTKERRKNLISETNADTNNSYSTIKGASPVISDTENSKINPEVHQTVKEGSFMRNDDPAHISNNYSEQKEKREHCTSTIAGPKHENSGVFKTEVANAKSSKQKESADLEVQKKESRQQSNSKDSNSEESYDALDDFTQDELESAMDSDQVTYNSEKQNTDKEVQTTEVSLEEASTQAVPSIVSQSNQTNPIKYCDFQVQAFENNEVHLATAHLPRPLKEYLTGAMLGQIEYFSQNPTTRLIEKSYHLLCAEMEVLLDNITFLNEFLQDQSMNNLFERTVESLPNLYTWRLTEARKFQDIMTEKVANFSNVSKVQTVYEEISKLTNEDFKSLSNEIKRCKEIYEQLQYSEQNININGLRDHQLKMRMQLREKMSQVYTRLDNVEKSLQVLKLCTVQKDKLGGISLFETLSRDLSGRQNLLSNIERLREELHDLKVGELYVKEKKENDTPLIKGEMETLSIVNVGLSLHNKKELGNILKYRSLDI